MSILSRLTYSLEVKLNIFLQAFEFKRHIKDPELQDDALLETFSAKMKTRNRAVYRAFDWHPKVYGAVRHSFSRTPGWQWFRTSKQYQGHRYINRKVSSHTTALFYGKFRTCRASQRISI